MIDDAVRADAVLAGVVIDVAGIPVRLHATDEARAEAVASLLRHAPSSSREPRCTFEVGRADVEVPESPPTAASGGAQLWYAGRDALWIRTDDGLVARCDDRSVTIGGDATSLTREVRFVGLIALTHVLARHDRHVLHGAAVVVDDHALLVLGETGTGKSTLAFTAHRRGWPVLADDAVVVHHATDGRVYADGLPRPMAVGADVVAHAIDGGRPVPDDARARTELPPGTLTRSTKPVAALVVTAGADDARADMEATRGAELFKQILRASTALADVAMRPELFRVAGALARLPAWTIRHGAEPGRALDDAGARLDELAAALRDGRVDRAGRTGS